MYVVAASVRVRRGDLRQQQVLAVAVADERVCEARRVVLGRELAARRVDLPARGLVVEEDGHDDGHDGDRADEASVQFGDKALGASQALARDIETLVKPLASKNNNAFVVETVE